MQDPIATSLAVLRTFSIGIGLCMCGVRGVEGEERSGVEKSQNEDDWKRERTQQEHNHIVLIDVANYLGDQK